MQDLIRSFEVFAKQNFCEKKTFIPNYILRIYATHIYIAIWLSFFCEKKTQMTINDKTILL